MAIISLTAEELQGRQLLDETGRGIGEISDLYVDDDGRPHWLLVDTSFFPGFFSVIPVTDVLVTDKGLEVHYTMEKLTGAPNNMKDKDYAKHREGLLYDYYRLEAPEGVEDATHHGEADKVLQPPSALCRFSTLSCENKPVDFRRPSSAGGSEPARTSACSRTARPIARRRRPRCGGRRRRRSSPGT